MSFGYLDINFASCWYYENTILCEPMPYDRGGFDVTIDIDRASSFDITITNLLTGHEEIKAVDKTEFIRQYFQIQEWKNGDE